MTGFEVYLDTIPATKADSTRIPAPPDAQADSSLFTRRPNFGSLDSIVWDVLGTEFEYSYPKLDSSKAHFASSIYDEDGLPLINFDDPDIKDTGDASKIDEDIDEETDETKTKTKTKAEAEPKPDIKVSRAEVAKYDLFKGALGNWLSQDSGELLEEVNKMSDEDIIAIAKVYEKETGDEAGLIRALEKRINEKGAIEPLIPIFNLFGSNPTKRIKMMQNLQKVEAKVAKALAKDSKYGAAALHESIDGAINHNITTDIILNEIAKMDDDKIAEFVTAYDEETGEDGALFKMLREKQSTAVNYLRTRHPLNPFKTFDGIRNILQKSDINKLEKKIAEAIAKKPELAAQALYTSMKGMGQNDHVIDAIIDSLDSQADADIIYEIMQEYKKISDIDLISAINNNYGGNRDNKRNNIFQEVLRNLKD